MFSSTTKKKKEFIGFKLYGRILSKFKIMMVISKITNTYKSEIKNIMVYIY